MPQMFPLPLSFFFTMVCFFFFCTTTSFFFLLEKPHSVEKGVLKKKMEKVSESKW